ncbi:MAG: phenylalanine--tRNA ligase subunit beta [Lautropia sp.]
MKFAESWLRAYCNPPLDAAGIEHLLTMGGLEVESCLPVAPPFDQVVLARVVSVEPHPDADRLTVCRVDTGDADAPRTVVCGAPNVRAGLWTACALPGARLPGGLTIGSSAMRGVVSDGMLCSSKELGIADDHAGILDLEASVDAARRVAGADIRAVLGLDDKVFELKVTPNLAHCMSITGVARELAALSRTPWQPPREASLPAALEDRLPVRIDAPALCGRFSGRIVRGVDARAPTPAWMRERLERAGQRSISALVDVSNYVMLELGRPTHVFDLGKIYGGLTVRWGRDGESLELLNGQRIDLAPLDGSPVGVIADERQVESLAGIMGGEATAVSLDTTDIYVEAAFWWPHAIAGRARRYNFSTDAAQRFERGVDASTTVAHVDYLSALIVSICGGRAGPIDDQVTGLPSRDPITLRLARARKVSGLDLGLDDCVDALERLELSPKVVPDDDPTTGPRIVVVPPARRFDLAIEEDLIEEVVRMHGFERIATRAPLAPSSMLAAPEGRHAVVSIKRRWAERDYQEVINFSFVARDEDARLGVGAPALAVLNPIAANLDVMRRSLWPGLLSNLVHNLNRKASRVRIFEVGRAYLREPDAPDAALEVAGIRQPLRVAALAYGPVFDEQWGADRRRVDFFDLKGDIEAIHRDHPLTVSPEPHPALHPGQSARVGLADGTPIGWIGALHPALVADAGLDHPVIVCELDLEPLLVRPPPSVSRESRFPPALRDLAIVVADTLLAGRILDELRVFCAGERTTACVVNVKLFDEYRGKGLENKEKSLAFRFRMQDTERTLSDADVDAAMSSIMDFLARRFDARQRAQA